MGILSPQRRICKATQLSLMKPFPICDILRDLVTFVQFKKREKHPWRTVTFSKVAGI